MKSIVFLIALVAGLNSFASDSLKTQSKYRKLYFFTYGLSAYSERNQINGEDDVANKMGFGYRRKAGCIVGTIKNAHITLHKKRVDKKLKKRFGNNWREQYETAIKKC